ERDDWHGWTDDWGGDLRPLVGIDACASMVQIFCMALGWRDEERAVTTSSFKDGLVDGMRAIGNAGGFVLPAGATDPQLRKAAGQLQTLAYGAQLSAMARRLNADPDTYGAPWGAWRNLERLLDHGAELDHNIRLLQRLKDEYLPVCRALAEAAVARDPYAGI